MAFFGRTDDNSFDSKRVSIAVLLLILIAGIITLATKAKTEDSKVEITPRKTCSTFIVKDASGKEDCVSLETADNDAERMQGLSGREKLDSNKGMVFVFDEPGKHCMWMKDMRFSLDMVWLDDGKKITEVKKDLNPESYPEEFCAQGKYVIEINAGTADRSGLKAGQQLNL